VCGSACLFLSPAGSKGVLKLSLNVTCSGAERVRELWEGIFLQERGGTMKQPNMKLALAYPTLSGVAIFWEKEGRASQTRHCVAAI
jgi:hypothetical protein